MDHELMNVCNEMLNEAHYGQRQEFPKRASGQSGAVEAGRGLSYQNNKLGLPTTNMAAGSVAGMAQFGNPTEQEEGEVIDKATVLGLVDNILDGLDTNVHMERVAAMILGELKKKIQKL